MNKSLRGSMKNAHFADILKRLRKQTFEEKLRIAFDLWQFVKDLQTQSNNDKKRKANSTRAIA